jgi:2-polyprenyl-3-methyl-5-hydroxy-6-metoxy-1,4-benzoquinol methylase
MMRKEIKEIDIEGLVTLNVIEKANRFNEWMYNAISPDCKGRILEIGSGIGNISKFFINDNKKIVLSDLRNNYCELLKEKFKNPILKIDLVNPNFDVEYKSLFQTFDSVFALNVIEHIENDILAINNCKKLLKEGGNLIILVPAYQWLFNNFDNELEHFRRYSRKGIKNIIKKNNLKVEKLFFFNVIGIFGWFLSGKILKKKTIPEGQMNLFNFLVPVFKLADKIVFRKIGLSVICIAKK